MASNQRSFTFRQHRRCPAPASVCHEYPLPFHAACVVAISAPTDFSAAAALKSGDPAVLKRPGPYDIVTGGVVSHGDYTRRKELWRFLGQNRLALLKIFGFDPAKEPQRLKRFSLADNLAPGCPPVLLLHARKDKLVEVDQAAACLRFLQDSGVPSELRLYEEGHSSELFVQNPTAHDDIVEFLAKTLRAKDRE